MFEQVGVARLRRTLFLVALVAPLVIASCTSSDNGGEQPVLGTGGATATGGSNAGGAVASGGAGPSSGGDGARGGSSGNSSTGGAGIGGGGAAPSSGGTTALGGTGGTDAGVDAGPPIPPPPVLTWTREGPPMPLLATWGSGANNIIASGGQVQEDILHSKGGGTWPYEASNTGQGLTGIWGNGPNDIYISVNANVILHSTGNGTWDHQGTTAGYTFDDIWASGPNDIYAVGSGIMHSTGDGTWTSVRDTRVGPGIWGGCGLRMEPAVKHHPVSANASTFAT